MITTLPVICFAGLGALTPRLARRFGAAPAARGVAGASATVGTGARAGRLRLAVPAAQLLALSGGAVSNVLMPALVKAHFPDRIGAMTAVYTTALAVGTTAGAGLTVPIGDLGGGWRVRPRRRGRCSVVIAIVPWLPTLRRDPARRRGTADRCHAR